ncbi:tRNA dimethylallyltransferase [Mactra antiquata]
MAASMRNPVVVIFGATGTGKTKLSLELAKIFNGEIISADAMQLYKGLDIITNKATTEERKLCPHHMIDYISPLKDNSTVVDYRNQALPIIDSLLKKQKTPIIVGGTNYYIESLLWKHLVNPEDIKRASSVHQTRPAKIAKVEGDDENKTVSAPNTDNSSIVDENTQSNTCSTDNSSEEPILTTAVCKSRDGADNDDESDDNDVDNDVVEMRGNREKYDSLCDTELHKRLFEIDSVSANRIHPKDRRKIIRALEVYDQHGIPMSKIYKAQHSELSDNTALSGPLRYQDTCVFWLQCDKHVLNQRLDDRVDKMMEMGLIDELTTFHKQYIDDRRQQGKEADYTVGIFQSIGYKQFHEYLILNEEERQTDHGKQLLEIGIENLKIATRQYASYQMRWVKRRMLRRPCKESVLPVYGLDCSDVSRWEELVSAPAASILTALRKGEESPISPIPYDGEDVQEFMYNECKTCDVVAVTKTIWEAHMSSRRHKKAVQHYRKLSQTLDTYIQQKQRSKSSAEEVS